MELHNRVELLAQLGNMGLSRVEQASLLEFLVGLPDATREAILDYVCHDPANPKLQLLKTLAAMDAAERNQTLNALGLLKTPSQRGFLDDLFSNPKQAAEATGSVMKELADLRDYFVKNLWQPFRRLTQKR